MTLNFVFLIAALLCFLIGTSPALSPRANLVALGLAFLTLAILVGGNPQFVR